MFRRRDAIPLHLAFTDQRVLGKAKRGRHTWHNAC